jgi:pimeloyl-ACP methyl ester carboxylesterase
VRFLELDVGLPYPVVGLISEPDVDEEGPVVIHVHGYGGDHYSNAFVRSEHAALSREGVAFVSLALPTSGYIVEQYSDAQVRYVGSALVHPEESLECVQRVARAYRDRGRRVILQGHSFGTNIVKELASRAGDLVQGVIFLSAADSVALQSDYEKRNGRRPVESGVDKQDLSWEDFGVLTEDRLYPIPIARSLFPELVGSAIFTTWSRPRLDDIQVPLLFIRCRNDSISVRGSLLNLLALGAPSERLRVMEIDGSSHSFIGRTEELLEALVRWLREQGWADREV